MQYIIVYIEHVYIYINWKIPTKTTCVMVMISLATIWPGPLGGPEPAARQKGDPTCGKHVGVGWLVPKIHLHHIYICILYIYIH